MPSGVPGWLRCSACSLRRPREAANTIIVAHGNILSAAASVTVVEGGAAIFRPEGEARFSLVATVTPAQWDELSESTP